MRNAVSAEGTRVVWAASLPAVAKNARTGHPQFRNGKGKPPETWATRHQTPQFTEALGAPIGEAWFSESTMEYGNPAKAELTIPVKGSRQKGDLRALAIKEDGRWKLKKRTLELSQSGERIDLLATSR